MPMGGSNPPFFMGWDMPWVPSERKVASMEASHKRSVARSLEYNRKLQQSRREQGLCPRCGEPVAPGLKHCRACLDFKKAKYSARTGRQPKDKAEKRQAPKKSRIKYDPAHVPEDVKATPGLVRYYHLKAHGICAACGKEPADKGKVLCWRCRLWRNQSKHGYTGRSPKRMERSK